MNIISKLSVRQLGKSKRRTMITIIGIVLSVALITAIAGFIVSFQDAMIRSAKETGGDWHVAFVNTSSEVVEELKGDQRIASSFIRDKEMPDGSMESAFFFRLSHPSNSYDETATAIAYDYNLDESNIADFNTTLLGAEGYIANEAGLAALTTFAAILIIIIVVGSILVIANAFYISASERIQQFGILKSVGATKWQITRGILVEGLLLGCIAIPIGIAVGFLFEFIALTIANTLLFESLNDMSLKVLFSPWVILLTVLISFVTILLSAYFPARKAAKTNAIESIRLTKQIKVKAKKLKASKLTEKFFGFKGTLASKFLKRNKGKFRSTIISLVISMVLFIGSFSFGQYLTKTTSLLYKDYDVNVVVSFISGAEEGEQKAFEIRNQLLPTIEGEKFSDSMRLYESSADRSILSPELDDLLQKSNQPSLYVQLHTIDRESYDAIKGQLHLSDEELKNNQGILINRAQIQNNGKIQEISPVLYTQGMELPLNEAGTSIHLAGEINEIPRSMGPFFNPGYINVLVPEETLRGLPFNESDLSQNYILIKSADPTAQTAELTKQLEELNTDSFINSNVINYEEQAQMTSNVTLLVMLFVYAFIAVLSLIAITNVIGTISTSMALRRQEFAMLLSVGMTQKELKKMLYMESFFYGIKALIIGALLGILASIGMYFALGTALSFSFIFPWQALIISFVAVFIIVFLTTMYSIRNLKNLNIIDSLKADTI